MQSFTRQVGLCLVDILMVFRMQNLMELPLKAQVTIGPSTSFICALLLTNAPEVSCSKAQGSCVAVHGMHESFSCIYCTRHFRRCLFAHSRISQGLLRAQADGISASCSCCPEFAEPRLSHVKSCSCEPILWNGHRRVLPDSCCAGCALRVGGGGCCRLVGRQAALRL